MADQGFETLEQYEDFLREQIKTWEPARRIALAAAMAERWLPAYETFSAAEQWGDPDILRHCLDAVWAAVEGRATATGWPRLSQQLQAITPHMDDFDANEALCACVMIEYALTCCQREDNGSDAVMAVLSGLEAVRPDLLTRDRPPARWWQQANVRREVNKQLRLLKHTQALTDLTNAAAALRPVWADPAMQGEVQPRKAPKAPPALTNQAAFEIYQRMILADIKGAARNLDPKQHPDLATGLYLGMWLGRYHRRQNLITGEYGVLADHIALDLLVAKNRARDRAEPDQPSWESSARWSIDICYRNPYNGLDVHSVEEPHGYGPSLRRLWVEAKRHGQSDVEAWESVRAWAYHQSPAWTISRSTRQNSLAAVQPYLDHPLAWQVTGDLERPWSTNIEAGIAHIRLNDFPDELMYSLSIEGQVIGDFHDWPKAWMREEG